MQKFEIFQKNNVFKFSGRRNDLPEFVQSGSSEPENPDRRVVKVLRRKIAEPNVANEMSERQMGLRRADDNYPLFRGNVEQVLDNRPLKPVGQDYIAPGTKNIYYSLISSFMNSLI
jgi:hypothetical protein